MVNNVLQLIEDPSEQLTGVLPKSYTDFSDEILSELLCIFNNSALDKVGGSSAKRDRKEKERKTNHQEGIEMKCPKCEGEEKVKKQI